MEKTKLGREKSEKGNWGNLKVIKKEIITKGNWEKRNQKKGK